MALRPVYIAKLPDLNEQVTMETRVHDEQCSMSLLALRDMIKSNTYHIQQIDTIYISTMAFYIQNQ